MSTHLIWSQDAFAAQELAARVRATAPDDAETVALTAEGAAVPGLEEALFAGSLFATSRVVEIREAERLTAAGVDVLAEALQRDPDALVVIVAVAERQPARLVKTLKDVAELHTFEKPRRGELVKLVERRMTKAGLKPERDAASTLVEAVGTELRDLAHAIEQVALRAGPGEVVTAGAILSHFSRGGEQQPIWALFDALVAKDGPRSYRVLRGLLEQGDDPIPLLFAILSQVRYVMRARGVLDASSVTDAELARALGCSPGRAKVLRRQAAQLSWDWLLAVHALCADADIDLKGGEEGEALPPEMVLERFVAGVLDAA